MPDRVHLGIEEGGRAGPNVVRLRGSPRDGFLCSGPMDELRRRLAAIRDQLDLPADPSSVRSAVALDGLLDLEVLAAELRRHRAAPWRELLDIANAVRAGGRRHALARLAQLAGPDPA